MKLKLFFILTIFVYSFLHAQQFQYSEEEINSANTAKNTEYLSQVEKEVIYYINLCRINPTKFLDRYIENGTYIKENEWYIKQNPKYLASLKQKLKSLKPLPLLHPDKALFQTALCLAREQEKSGATGHERKKCKKDFWGECCSYGESTGVGIVLQLLIDQDVPSLGHRKIILGDYSLVGVAFGNHKRYRNLAVIDFK